MTVTVTSTKLIIDNNGVQVRFNGQDIISATPQQIQQPPGTTTPQQWGVLLKLTGDAALQFPEGQYVINLGEGGISNQPTWENKSDGAVTAASDIAVMIRSTGGGTGILGLTPGVATDVDNTDPQNPAVDVRVDNVTIQVNGSNELEVIGGAGVTGVTASAPLSSSGGTTPNITHDNSGVVAGTYAYPSSVVVSNKGHVTSITAGSAPGTGDVVGPASAVDGHIVQFNGTTGKLIKDGLATSTGGNGSADSGKVPLYRSNGGLYSSSDNASIALNVNNSSTGDAVYASSGSGDAVHAVSTTGKAVHAIAAGADPAVTANGQGTGRSLHVYNQSTAEALLVEQNTAATDIAVLNGSGGDGVNIESDGTLNWTSATGAQGTATNLPVFGAATKGVVPASGGGTTNFLRADGTFAVPPGTATGTVTSVSVVSANGLAGSVATATTTPAITLSTTINSPVLAGNGTAISAATTTGSGSTVVLNNGPTLISPVLGTPASGDFSSGTFTWPTFNQNTTGSAATLTTSRTIQTDLASTSSASFNGSANITPGVTGTLPVANGGTGGTTVSGANTNLETSAVQRILLPQAATLTNQPNSLEILTSANPGIFINRVNLTNFTQVMLQMHVFTASASGNTPIVKIGYSTSYTTTAGSYSDIGTSAVSCSMSSAGVIQSAWTNLAAGAKADIYITGLTNGGNGTADPVIAMVTAFFR